MATRICAASFRNVVHFSDATKFHATCLRKELLSRRYAAVLVLGGSPCQDLSKLNPRRRGLQAPRTQLFAEIPRVAQECRELLASLQINIPVLQMLENVANGPDAVMEEFSGVMGCRPVVVHGSSFGWVRTRLFWGGNGQDSIEHFGRRDLPADMSGDPDAQDVMHFRWTGKKPWPSKIFFQDGFKPAFEAKANIGEVGDHVGFATFTRSLSTVHPDVNASVEAQARYHDDGRAYPAFAYETASWSGGRSHGGNPTPRSVPPCDGHSGSNLRWAAPEVEDAATAERVRASLAGNSFHVPSVMFILMLLLQMVPTVAGIPQPMYSAFETCLRNQVRGSAFQLGLVDSCPGLLTPELVMERTQQQFTSLDVQWPELQVTDKIRTAIRKLRIFKVDCMLRGAEDEFGAPQWRQQNHRALASSALGAQRGGPLSKIACRPLLPGKVDKATHMSLSTCLPSPFDTHAVLDPDASFAVRAMVAFGPCIRTWRRLQQRAIHAVSQFLAPWEKVLRSLMPGPVFRVASDQCPAMMTATAIVLDWPDLTSGLIFVKGFRLLGEIESP